MPSYRQPKKDRVSIHSCSVVYSNGGRKNEPIKNRLPPVILLLAAPRRLFCFGSLVILDVLCHYINIIIGKN